jgi:tetratricopeptide (TPR) repeat protein
MKKIINLIVITILTSSVYGQQTVDLLMRARAMNEEGKPDAAIIQLSKAIITTKDSRLYLERAAANLMQGDYSAAITDLNEANRLTPSAGDYGLARIYAIKGDAKTSVYHLEKDMNSSFRKSEKDIMLDPAFAGIENKPEWRQFWQKDWYSAIEKGVAEIEYFISLHKAEESIALLTELKKEYPGNDELIYADALINLSAGRNSDAVNKLTALSDRNNEKYTRLMAVAQFAVSNPAGASDSYSRLIESGVADAALFVLRAKCYIKTGEYDKALLDVEKYLSLYPADKTALSMAGKINSVSGDNLNALKYFSENLRLHPNDSECYVDRADSYFISKSWEWAIKDYTMSLDLNPGNSDVWLNKGISLLNTGKKDDACHDFRKSFSMGNKRASEYISRNCIK